jgi:hypothetical protein
VKQTHFERDYFEFLKVESVEGLAVGSWRTAAGGAETKWPMVTGNEWLVTGEDRKKPKAEN